MREESAQKTNFQASYVFSHEQNGPGERRGCALSWFVGQQLTDCAGGCIDSGGFANAGRIIGRYNFVQVAALERHDSRQLGK